MHVKLAERPSRDDPDPDELASGPRPRVPEPMPDVPLGLTVRELDRRFARQGSDSIQGVMVSRVDPTGAAFSAAIRPDFVIMEINRRPIRSVADYQHVIASAKPGDVLALYCYDPGIRQRTLVTVGVE
jgi:serine protease Do